MGVGAPEGEFSPGDHNDPGGRWSAITVTAPPTGAVVGRGASTPEFAGLVVAERVRVGCAARRCRGRKHQRGGLDADTTHIWSLVSSVSTFCTVFKPAARLDPFGPSAVQGTVML